MNPSIQLGRGLMQEDLNSRNLLQLKLNKHIYGWDEQVQVQEEV